MFRARSLKLPLSAHRRTAPAAENGYNEPSVPGFGVEFATQCLQLREHDAADAALLLAKRFSTAEGVTRGSGGKGISWGGCSRVQRCAFFFLEARRLLTVSAQRFPERLS